VPGAATVLVYGHYDVQPPDPVEAWESPPFEPSIRRGNIHSRGATDDKGQLFATVCAFEAASWSSGPAVNIRFLVEGQEESGGDVLARVLLETPGIAAADLVLVADGPYHAPGYPSVEVGVRGICYAEIEVRTMEQDLHSGLYGGVAPNAHEELVRILARLKDPSGNIDIPHFYDDVREPSARERRDWEHLPFDEAEFVEREMRARKTPATPSRYSVLERLWVRPTFEIHGIRGGFTGDGAKTVIPAVATAKVSLRLVPDQTAHVVFRRLERSVQALAPRHADVECRFVLGADPVLVNTDHVGFGYIDAAFREVEGRGVVWTRSGGSLPVLTTLARSGTPVVLAGIGLPDDAPHAPNEKMSIDQFVNGARVFARFFEMLGGMGKTRVQTEGEDA
jgi:acetylornithine deacetylase/succinyl-diaminopimelate desuccinylase-like protein